MKEKIKNYGTKEIEQIKLWIDEFLSQEIEGAEILLALRGIDGSEVGRKILKEIIVNNRIRKVAIFGEPGANKSTVLFQLGKWLQLLGISVRYTMYDDVLAEAESVMGERTKWGSSEWSEFSKLMKDAVCRCDQTLQRQDGRHVQLIETMSMGARFPRDRAISTLEWIANDAKENLDSLIVGIVPDYRSQEEAGNLRSMISTSPPTQVLQILNDFGIEILDLNEYGIDVTKKSQLKVIGAKIKASFLKMGKKENIEVINQEVFKLAHEDITNNMTDWLEYYLSFPLPESIQIDDFVQQTVYKSKAFHMRRLINTEIGLNLPTDQGIVAFSPYVPLVERKIRWYAGYFL
jgi:hypothetical protein